MGDALTIERIELLKRRTIQFLAFAGKALGGIPVAGAVASEKLAVPLGQQGEVPGFLNRIVAEERKHPRRFGLTLDLEEVNFEEGEIGGPGTRGFTDNCCIATMSWLPDSSKSILVGIRLRNSGAKTPGLFSINR